MYSKFNTWLNNPAYFRYGFVLVWVISLVLTFFAAEFNGYFYIFYIVGAAFLGLGFYHKSPWFLVILTTLLVVCRFFFSPEDGHNLITFLFYIFTYLLITFISVGFMKNYQRTKEDNIELIKALSNALDMRDTYTMNHSENVARVALDIARGMNLPKKVCEGIYIGGLLHDIGKIGIPERVLSKSGKLTDDEYEIIKNHTFIGYQIINHISYFAENGVLDIVLYHHERYDGRGYPEGLKGEQIPIAARIMAIADTFDAMTSKRVYREELDLQYALSEIRTQRGTQFDPDIVDVFLGLYEEREGAG
ncbi:MULTISPECIES: HD-GYP domain-containing protein [unclassified Bacillus (in: firmicutes)]|uniref:HD-GYP domain-containing protein n=1 Tax=unclassified Bacillus (in: firmicutes) TaxID=185979 RepID=UPI0008EE593B|nr:MULTISPECIES: HD-GYP domain-containing protein [unclassified Bacillus (in: firmicutes)]SFB20170.1 HDIG domain-containing protein [Bacillus sp. UNCCL13]SFQ90828.1 HDIG domain-containing protein [Bacillus sp. cl95]